MQSAFGKTEHHDGTLRICVHGVGAFGYLRAGCFHTVDPLQQFNKRANPLNALPLSRHGEIVGVERREFRLGEAFETVENRQHDYHSRRGHSHSSHRNGRYYVYGSELFAREQIA